MVEESWNLHGWIAFPLETTAQTILNMEREEIRGTFLSADSIETGSFVEVMFYLLRKQNGLTKSYSDFAAKCQPFFGKPLTMEHKLQETELYNEFRKLLED